MKPKIKSVTNLKEMLLSPYFEVHPGRIKSKIILIGVIGVSEINERTILIKCHGTKIKISGSNISLSVFEQNALEVTGKVEGIQIIDA